MALEATFDEPESIVPAAPRRLRGPPEPISLEDVDAVLFTPSRPGAVLAEATRRRFPVG